MEMKKPNNKLLLILGVSFIAVFAIALILVNSWLKSTLKEEIVTEKPAASIPILAKPKYIQPPIAAPEPQEKQKSASSEKTATAGKEPVEKAPGADEKFLIN